MKELLQEQNIGVNKIMQSPGPSYTDIERIDMVFIFMNEI